MIGLNPLSTLDHYWKEEVSKSPYGSSKVLLLLSKNKFEWINHRLKSDLKETKSKIEFKINSIFKSSRIPGSIICIDETIIGFKGHMSNRVHMPMKPNSTGVKLYLTNEYNGYVLNFFIYKGENSLAGSAAPIEVVTYFLNELKLTNRVWIMDSGYGSLQLAEQLQEADIQFVMSVKSDRPTWLFQRFLHSKLKKGIYFKLLFQVNSKY